MTTVQDEQLYNHQGSGRYGNIDKMSINQIFCFISLITFCLTLICIQILGDIFIYDYRNFATDNSAANNKAALGPAISFPPIGTCDSTYALSDSNVCIRSRSGLYLNTGVTSTTKTFAWIDGIDSYFEDHNTNSIAARIFVNPLNFTGSLERQDIFKLWINVKVNFQLSATFTGGGPGTQGVRFINSLWIDPHGLANYYDSLSQLITAPSWVDVLIIFEYVQNAAGKVDMAEKVYSTGWNDPLSQLDSLINPNNLMSDLVGPNTEIIFVNHHHSDFTFQYVNVYGGSQTLDSISSALCAAPIAVPPEHCSDASTLFLSNGCTDSVNSPCRTTCVNFPCTGSPVCSSAVGSSSNYTSPFTSYQVVIIAVSAAVAADAVLVGFYFLLALCLFI